MHDNVADLLSSRSLSVPFLHALDNSLSYIQYILCTGQGVFLNCKKSRAIGTVGHGSEEESADNKKVIVGSITQELGTTYKDEENE